MKKFYVYFPTKATKAEVGEWLINHLALDFAGVARKVEAFVEKLPDPVPDKFSNRYGWSLAIQIP